MTTPRHDFYETDEKLTLSIFDKGADSDQVQIQFEPRKFSYSYGESTLVLEPLKGQIDPDASNFTVGKFKVEVRLAKMAQGRWGGLTGDSPDPLSALPAAPVSPPTDDAQVPRKQRKNWDAVTETILKNDKSNTTDEDPNAGGDTTVNTFFQDLFKNADDDTRRAMMKSMAESGGTTLSTNWDEVKKGPVEVKPPEGSEWKQWG